MDNKLSVSLANRVSEVDGFAGVYPEHKHQIVEALQAKGCLVGMTGEPRVHILTSYSTCTPSKHTSGL